MDDEDLYSVFDQEFGTGAPEDEAAPLAVTPPDLQSQVLGLFSQIGENRKRGDALRQQQLEQATRMLEQRKFGPSMAERLFQLSAAFATPSRTRGLAGVLGNVMPVLAQQTGQVRGAHEQKEDVLRQLRDRYALAGVESEGAGYKDQLAALKTAASLAPKQQRQRLALTPLGDAIVDLDAGRSRPVITQAHIAALKATPAMAEEFDKKFGPGAAAEILGTGGQTGSAPSGGFRNIPSGNPLDPGR